MAGIRPGDKIIAVDSQNVTGDNVSASLRGNVGDIAKVLVRSNGKTFEAVMARKPSPSSLSSEKSIEDVSEFFQVDSSYRQVSGNSIVDRPLSKTFDEGVTSVSSMRLSNNISAEYSPSRSGAAQQVKYLQMRLEEVSKVWRIQIGLKE